MEVDPGASWRCPCCKRALEDREEGAREAERYRYLETCSLLVVKQENENHALRVEIAAVRQQLTEVAELTVKTSAIAMDAVRKARARDVERRRDQ